MGAYVTAVCSATHAELIRQLGADRIIDHEISDFTQEPETYNVIFDAVGKSSFDDTRPVLTDNGIYVTTLPSAKQVLESVVTTFTSQKTKSVVMTFSQEDMTYLLTLAGNGRLMAIIDRKYRMEELSDAHDYSEHGHVEGKLVLVVTEEES